MTDQQFERLMQYFRPDDPYGNEGFSHNYLGHEELQNSLLSHLDPYQAIRLKNALERSDLILGRQGQQFYEKLNRKINPPTPSPMSKEVALPSTSVSTATPSPLASPNIEEEIEKRVQDRMNNLFGVRNTPTPTPSPTMEEKDWRKIFNGPKLKKSTENVFNAIKQNPDKLREDFLKLSPDDASLFIKSILNNAELSEELFPGFDVKGEIIPYLENIQNEIAQGQEEELIAEEVKRQDAKEKENTVYEPYYGKQVIPFEAKDKLSARIRDRVIEYNALEAQREKALDANDYKKATMIANAQEILKPHTHLLEQLGSRYEAAYDLGDKNALKQLSKSITDVEGYLNKRQHLPAQLISGLPQDILQALPQDMRAAIAPPAGETNKVSKSNPFGTEDASMPPMDKFSVNGEPAWKLASEKNLLRNLYDELNTNPVYPKVRPILKPSKFREQINEGALRNVAGSDINQRFNTAYGNLEKLTPASFFTGLAKSQNRATQDPFDVDTEYTQTIKQQAMHGIENLTGQSFMGPKSEVQTELENVASEGAIPGSAGKERLILDKYFNPYQSRVTDRAVDDLIKDYHEKVWPLIETNLIRNSLDKTGSAGMHRQKALNHLSDNVRRLQEDSKYKGWESALNAAMNNRKANLEASHIFGEGGLRGAHAMSEIPQMQAAANILNSNTLEKVASQEEKQKQAIKDAEYEQDQKKFHAPAKIHATMLDALRGTSASGPSFTVKPPEAPAMSPSDLMQYLVMQNAMGRQQQYADGGSVKDDYNERVMNLINYYRSRQAPDPTREMLGNVISNMYSGDSKFIVNNIAKSMPGTLEAMRASQRSVKDNEIKALELQNLLRKLEADDEEKAYSREQDTEKMSLNKGYFELEKGKHGQQSRLIEAQINKILNEAEEEGIPFAERVKIEKELRGEVAKESSVYKEIRSAYKKVNEAAKNPSPANDIALLYGIMKLYDPGSVVRETEYAEAAEAGNVPTRLLNAYNRAVDGTKLTDSQRADFIKSARGIYKTQLQNYKDVTNQYKDLSNKYGVDPSNVVLFEPEEAEEEQPEASRHSPYSNDQIVTDLIRRGLL